MPKGYEVEMKLIAPDKKALVEARAALKEICDEVKFLRRQRIVDTYYDTADMKIFRAGYACRIRKTLLKKVITMKALTPPRGGISMREELEQALQAGTRNFNIPFKGKIGSILNRITEGRMPRKLFIIKNLRSTYEIRCGELVAEAALDHFVILAGKQMKEYFEVEIEMKKGPVLKLKRLGCELRGRTSLQKINRAKFREGLKLAGIETPHFRTCAIMPKLMQ